MVGTTQAAAPRFGETRVTFLIEQLFFPDGGILDLGKAKLGDASGQAGLPGDVNNHIDKLALSSLLSATISVAARAPFGNQQGFSENLPQQYAGQVGQSLGQSGQQVVQQRFGNIPPTISIEAGADVTVTLGDSLSFMTPPVVVK
jgi:type IV secretion system protein VirB10